MLQINIYVYIYTNVYILVILNRLMNLSSF